MNDNTGIGIVLLVVVIGAALWLIGGGLYLAYGLPALIVLVLLLAVPILLYLNSRQVKAAAKRRAEHDRQAAHAAWMYRFEQPEIRAALFKLLDPFEASQLWASMGMGTIAHWTGSGANARLEPGAWPQVVDADPTPIGAKVVLEAEYGHSLKHYADRRGQLVMALNVREVNVSADVGERVVLWLKVRDPLTEMHVSHLLDPATRARIEAAVKAATTPAEEAQYLTEACRDAQLTVPVNSLSCNDDITLMIDQNGGWITVNLAAGAHGAAQGASRSGKSVFLNNLLAAASLMRDVRVVIIDPNSALAAPWWRTAYLVSTSSNPAEATKILAQVNKELKAREHLFWSGRTDRITHFSPELPLYLVVIDEVPEFAGNKEFQAEFKRFGAQAAKFGGRGYPAGQKLDEDSLSPATKANLFDRFCFRVETQQAMKHVLENAVALQAAGLDAVDEKMPQGVAIVRTRRHPETTRARALYLPTEGCWAISDAIVAVRGEVRPLPAPKPQALSTDKTDTPDSNILETTKPAALEPKKDTTAEGDTPRKIQKLPKLPQAKDARKVIPFDRSTRPDDTDSDDRDRDEDTGTE
ncbi:FtsK/SpoIIIE domain-containing protein [Nocardia acidivorans]|uniref:FtsK/SpoIIIE domain-containing protein n=1 Tax=Nocardia acidivorans TaxID=404580 RepID=UPI000830C0C4|nr:FtsK/SpoIIIE domain-containing protein [Nocardia acidivorans]